VKPERPKHANTGNTLPEYQMRKKKRLGSKRERNEVALLLAGYTPRRADVEEEVRPRSP